MASSPRQRSVDVGGSRLPDSTRPVAEFRESSDARFLLAPGTVDEQHAAPAPMLIVRSGPRRPTRSLWGNGDCLGLAASR
jgi:hypothetical protein